MNFLTRFISWHFGSSLYLILIESPKHESNKIIDFVSMTYTATCNTIDPALFLALVRLTDEFDANEFDTFLPTYIIIEHLSKLGPGYTRRRMKELFAM